MDDRYRDLFALDAGLMASHPCRDCMTVAVPVAGGRFVAAGRLLSGLPRVNRHGRGGGRCAPGGDSAAAGDELPTPASDTPGVGPSLSQLDAGIVQITMPLPWALDHVHCYAVPGDRRLDADRLRARHAGDAGLVGAGAGAARRPAG